MYINTAQTIGIFNPEQIKGLQGKVEPEFKNKHVHLSRFKMRNTVQSFVK